MLLLISCNNLLIFYLSIELFSLSLYILATFQRDRYSNTEAGLKYFLLGALSSGILLLGCTILYLYSGEITFTGIQSILYFSSDFPVLLLGGMFFLIGILFKLAAAPFHN
jgi:NADH-quinone oxidoreductase subunit N